MTRPKIESIAPFFIVSHVETIIAFYREKLGFELQYKEPEQDPFFAIIARDGAWLRRGFHRPLPVIASAAKQSSGHEARTGLIRRKRSSQ
jgi:catechol 2,3-dioxygenase-like lactoylglutathione lyase family enzyme